MSGFPQADYTPSGQIDQAGKFYAGLRRPAPPGWRRVVKRIGVTLLLASVLVPAAFGCVALIRLG